MILYFGLLLISYTLIFLSIDRKVWQGRYFLMPIFIFILIILAGFREGIGPDYYSYLSIYNSTSCLSKLGVHDFILLEPGFVILNSIGKSFGLGFSFVAISVSVIMFINIIKASQRFGIDIQLTISLYFALFYISHQYNIIRHGVAISFVWLALSFIKDKSFIKFIIFIFMGSLFHKVALFAIPFYFLGSYRLKYWVVILIIIMSFAIGLTFNFVDNPLFAILFGGVEKYQYYIQDYYANIDSNPVAGVSLGTMLNIIWVVIIYRSWFINERRENVLFCNALLFGVCSVGLFNKNGVFVERLSGLFYPTLIFIIPQFYFKFKKQWAIIFMIMLYCTFYFFKGVTAKDRFGHYEYIPYKSLFFNVN